MCTHDIVIMSNNMLHRSVQEICLVSRPLAPVLVIYYANMKQVFYYA